MAGLSARLPLSKDPQDGIGLIKNYKDLVKQNLKNLLLTIPGERVMIPDFGVGLATFLFEQDTPLLRSEISAKIREQVSKYMPFLEIINILFQSAFDNDEIDKNFESMKIEYNIIPLNFTDNLDVSVTDTDLKVI